MILKSKKLDEIRGYFINPKTLFNINAGEYENREETFDLIMDIGSNRISHFIDETNISCGIHQLKQLPGTFTINVVKQLVKPEYKDNFFPELYKEVIRLIKKKELIASVILSTNKHQLEVIKIFDRICVQKTRWKTNPNSTNKIRMWVL